MSNTSAPDYCLSNYGFTRQRQWKALKRRQAAALKKALDEYRLGCAFTPLQDGEVGKIQVAIESIIEAQSVRNWGR